MAKNSQNSHAFLCYRFANRGYLDLAITKNSQRSHALLCYRFATCSFANFLQWLHLNNLAIKLSVKLAKNGRKNIWSVKVGVHQLVVEIWIKDTTGFFALSHLISAIGMSKLCNCFIKIALTVENIYLKRTLTACKGINEKKIFLKCFF